MNRDEFIEKARKKHGDKYDYSKIEAINDNDHVCIICPEHGEFWQRPKNHIKGYGCTKCGRNAVSEKLSLNTDSFIKKAYKVHGNKYDYSKVNYINNHTKVCIICPEHGEFWQTPNDHLDNHGCIKCRDVNISKTLSDTTNIFIEKARKTHGDKYDYSKVEYKGGDIKVCIICPIHGEFWQTPHAHLRGDGCKKCGIEKRTKERSLTTEEFIKRATIKHNGKYDYSKVEYVNWFTPVCIICPEHGEFWQRAGDHLNGHGCDKCVSSKLEEQVENLLNQYNIIFDKHVTSLKLKWLGYKHLDFYLPDYNIAIECQGEQHYEPVKFGGISEERAIKNFETQKQRDIEKQKLCLVNNIELIYFTKRKYNYLSNVITTENKLIEIILNGKKE